MADETMETQRTVRQHPARAESAARLKRRRLADRWAQWLVAAGGFTIIASILAILFFILIEVAPLFQGAEVSEVATFPSSAVVPHSVSDSIVAIGLNENQEVAYALTQSGRVHFFSLVARRPVESFVLRKLREGEFITCAWQSLDGRRLVAGTDAGRAVAVTIRYNGTFFEGTRTYQPGISEAVPWQVDPEARSLRQLVFAGDVEEAMAVAAVTDTGGVVLYRRSQEESMFGDVEVDSATYAVSPLWQGVPAAIALDGDLRNLYVGAGSGKLYHWTLTADAPPTFVTTVKAVEAGEAAVTSLQFLIGDRTLLIGDSSGDVGAWFLVRDASSPAGWRLTRIHRMARHDHAITALVPSARGKGFVSADAAGILKLQHTTSERLLATFAADSGHAVAGLRLAPKANGALSLDTAGNFTHWLVHNPHPEAGFKAFFGKVWYEGYQRPEYAWQSTGGSDEFEPKLSLVPLIFGSLKGTFYTLILAVPLAILAALYTSQFMRTGLRNKIKPVVEIMAALPSVVLGFLAGLWLAPRIDAILPALLTMAVVLPLLMLVASFGWRNLPHAIRNRFRPGVEGMVAIPIICAGVVLSLQLNGFVESSLFAGDFKRWLYDAFSLTYDQRNALVVGMAMGFAIIPIIYTIAEDAFSNVPTNLISGSLAMGATRWQTAIKVVLPTAAAGIFSAVMIGFGRAVGETMIVLMATGNTPILDWNMFNGFRTLSANIAVEIPEAPVGGTLYRVLFLAAMLLFALTFVINTLAETVRQKLREKYQKL